ncbi:hypothetical protein BKP45_05140 [Anaerobacillus alkalidiazotrophicus]|uniref:HTH lacI-type domain-containing protein n=1 Tax=Anaerobacillus alkalidiazotrophicus TaxID=472963 RepID=A0A1S2MC91_9BACI|nr:helix-turn-helix transcriptional regulator [Anaerobacillus alkalidiazotrophicus]OIJ22063.1 hypothetical protein BKP45_05140 [Anaerobacillus alkalidiazotrophicus]
MSWFRLGKKRSSFGRLLDEEGVTQEEVAKASNVGHTTISKLCNDDTYTVKYSTGEKIKKGLKKLGYDKNVDKYLGM